MYNDLRKCDIETSRKNICLMSNSYKVTLFYGQCIHLKLSKIDHRTQPSFTLDM